MLQLDSKSISDDAQKMLDFLQRKVNAKPTFKEKTKKAGSLWEGKSSTGLRRAAFEEVKNTLTQMCVSVEICNYCEQSEANDIEHIYPKSLFPGKAFEWENYLLACKQCNTAYKLDAFAILDVNDDIFDIPRGSEPPNERGAFINPRLEDPSVFMLLNAESFKFEPLPGLSKSNLNKAKKTIEVLQLNDRDQLVESRRAAAIYFYQRMDLLMKIMASNSIAEIEAFLTPYDDLIDDTLPLAEIQTGIKNGFRRDVKLYPHPSVWYSIKTIESVTNTKWQAIFQAIPEAIHW